MILDEKVYEVRSISEPMESCRDQGKNWIVSPYSFRSGFGEELKDSAVIWQLN